MPYVMPHAMSRVLLAQFHLSTRYAQLLVTYYICLIYGTGVPLLYPIGCVSFATTYWVDKWLFMRFYRSPPHYSDEICVRAARLTAFPALLVHLAMSIWILGNESIFISNAGGAGASSAYWIEGSLNAQGAIWDSIAAKICQKHVMLLTMTLIVYLVGCARRGPARF